MTATDEPAAPLRGASYLVPVDNGAALVRHAGKLLERTRNAGVDCGLEWRLEPQPQVLRDGDLHQWVMILSQPPAVRGWSFAARYDIDPLGMTAAIPHAVPGVELPRGRWLLRDPVCEHCRQARDRRALFLLAHADGRDILVGRSCLKAFLNVPDPERVAALFDSLVPDAVVGPHLVRDPGAPHHGGGYLDGVEELAWTAGIVACYGWRSVAKSDAEHTATASRLAFLMNRPNPKLQALWDAERAACTPTAEHYATAHKTVELIRDARPDSEYLVKLQALAAAPAVHVRDRSLWCSAITLHSRWRLATLEGVALLEASPDAEDLARRLLDLGAVPREAAADAAHIAIAAANGIEYLVTWNFRHIANAAMRVRIERACRAAGYEPPVICTPNELTETDHADDGH